MQEDLENLEQQYFVYDHNKFQAMKFGFAANIILSNNDRISIQEDILATMDKVYHIAKS